MTLAALSGLRWRIVIIARLVAIGFLFVGRGSLLVAYVEHAAIVIFKDHVEPTAARGVVVKRIMIGGVVGEHPTRSELVANQRPRIFFFTSRYSLKEFRQVRVLVQ